MLDADRVVPVVLALEVRIGPAIGRQPEEPVRARPDLVVLRDVVAVGGKRRPEQVDVPGIRSQSNQLRVSVDCETGLYGIEVVARVLPQVFVGAEL